MKKRINFLAISVLVFFGLTCRAQEVKDQTAQLKSLPAGNYRAVKLLDDEKGGYNYDLYPEPIVLREVRQDPNFNEHKFFIMEEDGKEVNYVIDNYAFPVTYGKEYFMGNEKLQEKVGYIPREFSQGRTVHVAIIDGIIYDFNWKFDSEDPETFVPYRILVPESFLKEDKTEEGGKKKKLSLKERMMRKLAGNNPQMKAALRVNDKLRAMDAAQIPQEYITAALEKQKQVEAAWKQNAYNKQRVELLEQRREMMFKAIKKYNDDLMDTPEWRRIQENNRRANAAGAANNVTIKNETGRDIYLYEEGSMNGTRINAGSSGSFSCSSSYYYAFDGNSGTRGGNGGKKIYSANTGCGNTVNIE